MRPRATGPCGGGSAAARAPVSAPGGGGGGRAGAWGGARVLPQRPRGGVLRGLGGGGGALPPSVRVWRGGCGGGLCRRRAGWPRGAPCTLRGGGGSVEPLYSLHGHKVGTSHLLRGSLLCCSVASYRGGICQGTSSTGINLLGGKFCHLKSASHTSDNRGRNRTNVSWRWQRTTVLKHYR